MHSLKFPAGIVFDTSRDSLKFSERPGLMNCSGFSSAAAQASQE
jgi:hypothetical protein